MTAAAAKSVRLLVAEDNPLIRELIEGGMETSCEVIFAPDGGDALLKVIDDPPDVILCDYKMPGLDGRQLFEKLRGRQLYRERYTGEAGQKISFSAIHHFHFTAGSEPQTRLFREPHHVTCTTAVRKR